MLEGAARDCSIGKIGRVVGAKFSVASGKLRDGSCTDNSDFVVVRSNSVNRRLRTPIKESTDSCVRVFVRDGLERSHLGSDDALVCDITADACTQVTPFEEEVALRFDVPFSFSLTTALDFRFFCAEGFRYPDCIGADESSQDRPESPA